ncbi:MAG: hopanoid biosynthesis associated membrane protein HpnM, partial [Rhodospirillaceae bacterium]
SGTEAPPSQLVMPVQVVEDLHDVLVNVMQNARNLGWQGRYDLLHPVLVRAYNFSNMARVAAGSYWKTFTDSQRENVIEAFSRMSIATYASRFDAYGGEQFETMAVAELPQRGVMVQTRLVRTDGTAIKLSYRLAETEEGWKIVDVFYRGTISELANQRTQYLTVLNRVGYKGLLQRLDEKVHKLAVGQEAGAAQ